MDETATTTTDKLEDVRAEGPDGRIYAGKRGLQAQLQKRNGMSRREARRALHGHDRRSMLLENDARRVNQRAKPKREAAPEVEPESKPLRETRESGLVVPTDAGELWTP
jgi:hypothetical protein